MDWYKVLEIAIGPLISIFIMIVTLLVQQGHNRKSLQQQRNQFDESFKSQENHYRENLSLTKKQFRLSIMPYLILEDNVEIQKRNDGTVFIITLKNIGKGIATNVNVVTYDDNLVEPVGDEDISSKCKRYKYVGFLYNNVLQTNDLSNFEIMMTCDTTGVLTDAIENFKATGRCTFEISFSDLELNRYVQTFTFMYNINDCEFPINFIDSSIPKLQD